MALPNPFSFLVGVLTLHELLTGESAHLASRGQFPATYVTVMKLAVDAKGRSMIWRILTMSHARRVATSRRLIQANVNVCGQVVDGCDNKVPTRLCETT